MSFTISDLKKELGPGLGLRKSKYLLEIPVPGTNGKKINILCRSTSFPERNVGTVDVYDKGRKYRVRAETTFASTYTISVVDDSNMTLRYLFDSWLFLVDQTKPKNDGILGHFVSKNKNIVDPTTGIVNAANNLGTSFEVDENMSFSLKDPINGVPNYQADVNIWQLNSVGKKVYGYKLQHAFPSGVGTVELDDGDETNLSEFSVDFSYSEHVPLKNNISDNTNNDTTSTLYYKG